MSHYRVYRSFDIYNPTKPDKLYVVHGQDENGRGEQITNPDEAISLAKEYVEEVTAPGSHQRFYTKVWVTEIDENGYGIYTLWESDILCSTCDCKSHGTTSRYGQPK